MTANIAAKPTQKAGEAAAHVQAVPTGAAKGRTLGKDGILLVETKHAIGSVDSKIKAVIEHKDYGRALMIHWKDWHDPKNRTAMTVTYDAASDKNVLDAVFRCAAMPTY